MPQAARDDERRLAGRGGARRPRGGTPTCRARGGGWRPADVLRGFAGRVRAGSAVASDTLRSDLKAFALRARGFRGGCGWIFRGHTADGWRSSLCWPTPRHSFLGVRDCPLGPELTVEANRSQLPARRSHDRMASRAGCSGARAAAASPSAWLTPLAPVYPIMPPKRPPVFSDSTASRSSSRRGLPSSPSRVSKLRGGPIAGLRAKTHSSG